MTNNETPNPAGILCHNGHRHGSVESVKACYFGSANPGEPVWGNVMRGAGSPSAPVAPPMPAARPSVAPATAPQALLDAIARHGVTPKPEWTGREAREVLARLIEGKETRERAIAESSREVPEAEKVTHKTSLGISAEMIFDIREGRFAVSLTGSRKLDFVRLSIVKQSKSAYKKNPFVGCMKVQTQHGDSLRIRAYIAPNGEVVLTSHSMDEAYLTQLFMGIIVNQREAAKLYGREKGMCCRCGKDLTDERSRYYGIGPECEKHWEEYVADIDETEGAFVPGQMLGQ